MRICLCSLLLLFLLSNPLRSQILPEENSKLHYRLIGFRFPAEEKTVDYNIELSIGTFYNEDSFKNNIIQSLHSRINRIILTVPSFGQTYTWRVIYTIGHSKIKKSILYHFSTLTAPCIDTSNARLRILNSTEKYKDAFVLLDGYPVIYDMSGQAIWFFPPALTTNEQPNIRDIKITSQGTITYLVEEQAGYEISYIGDILWKTPGAAKVGRDTIEHFHHEFTRLRNGNYMILGRELLYSKIPLPPDKTLSYIPVGKKSPDKTDNNYVLFSLGTIIEYDKKGAVSWSWKSSDHMASPGIVPYVSPDTKREISPHENAFYFDDNTNSIYLSCKNVSKIIKINYPAGNILNIYGGDSFNPTAPRLGNEMFCGQHSCKISEKGDLYLFNNNSCNPDAQPRIMIFAEPLSEKDSLKKIWEFECPGKVASRRIGGNVIELPDQCMFASSCNPYSILFIVNPAKEILWSAVSEKWNSAEKKWEVTNLYRASIITNRQDLERLIWGEEKQ